MEFVLPPPTVVAVPVAGTEARFPVRRIYCVGRNYADHAREMGLSPERGAPIFFAKPADALVLDGADVPYPPGTADLHHEVEMVLALRAGGRDLDEDAARAAIFGYGVGLDLTRRDQQARLRKLGAPWEVAKSFDHSAPLSALHPIERVGEQTHARLTLDVDGVRVQDDTLDRMLFSPVEVLVELSKLFELAPGDLVYTGTPAGVGPLVRGQRFVGRLGAFAVVEGRIV